MMRTVARWLGVALVTCGLAALVWETFDAYIAMMWLVAGSALMLAGRKRGV